MSKTEFSSFSLVDPLQFDTLLTAFQHPEAGLLSTKRSTDPTDYTEKSLSSILYSLNEDDPFSSIRRSIEDYPQPSLIVSEDGQIIAINQPAYDAFDLEVADHIDNCGIQTIENFKLTDKIANAIRTAKDDSHTSFCRATFLDGQRPISLAIVPQYAPQSKSKSALVFVVDIGWDDAIGRYISQSYGLTNTEQEILKGFILGRSLDQIALDRDRSAQTVRTQFYTALNKCGLTTQVDLIREVVAGSMFQSLGPRPASQAEHPHRTELKMLRPGGRTLDVVATGDLSGMPVFLTASFGIQKFSPQKSKKLHEAGICVYAISPPGYGDTSPQSKGADRIECFAQDVSFVLDQLDLTAVPFVAVGASLLPTIDLAQKIPDRISGIQSFITVPPIRYQRKSDSAGKISVGAAVGNAVLVSPKLKNLVVRSALKAWMILGVRKMAKIQSMSEPEVAPFLLDPETLQAADEGFKSAIRQGFAQPIIDAERVFSDWSEDAATCPVPLTLVHGKNDKTTSIESVREFARDYAEKINLVEIDDAGSFLHITHDEVYIDRLRAFSAEYPSIQGT